MFNIFLPSILYVVLASFFKERIKIAEKTPNVKDKKKNIL